MASYDHRRYAIIRSEYSLPAKTNWAEVDKVFAALRQELGEERASWDSAVWIDATDGETIRFYTETVTEGVPWTT